MDGVRTAITECARETREIAGRPEGVQIFFSAYDPAAIIKGIAYPLFPSVCLSLRLIVFVRLRRKELAAPFLANWGLYSIIDGYAAPLHPN